MLVDAITNVYGNLSGPEQYSLKKVIRNITGAFQTYFGDWTVGIGLEEQVIEKSVLKKKILPQLTHCHVLFHHPRS